MRNHTLLKSEHVPISDFDVSSCFRFEFILLGSLSQDFMNKELLVCILDLTVKNPQRDLVDKYFDSCSEHFLEPFSRVNVRIFIFVIKIIDYSTTSEILIINKVNGLGYLAHDKLERLKLSSKVGECEMSIFKEFLFYSEDKFDILIHGSFESLVHGFAIHTGGLIGRKN